MQCPLEERGDGGEIHTQTAGEVDELAAPVGLGQEAGGQLALVGGRRLAGCLLHGQTHGPPQIGTGRPLWQLAFGQLASLDLLQCPGKIDTGWRRSQCQCAHIVVSVLADELPGGWILVHVAKEAKEWEKRKENGEKCCFSAIFLPFAFCCSALFLSLCHETDIVDTYRVPNGFAAGRHGGGRRPPQGESGAFGNEPRKYPYRTER